jgi:hypothetical protein
MLSFLIPSRNGLSPGTASLLILLAAGATTAHAQGTFPDNQYISFSPQALISTEPFTMLENSPNVPNGATVSVVLETLAGFVPSGNNTSGTCVVTQVKNAASCQLGRVTPGQYRLFVTSYSGSSSYLNAQLDFSVAGPGANTISALQGQYAFFITTPPSENSTTPSASAAAGSFTADGQGNITAGVMDLNGVESTYTDLPVTGKYQLDNTGKGTITLATSQGTVSFAIFVPIAQTLTNVALGTLVTSAGGLVTGSGTFVSQSGLIQNPSPVNPGFASYLNRGYHFRLTGETSPVPFYIAGAGQFTFTAAGRVTSAGQLTANGASIPFTGLNGTYTPVDGTTGRTTMTIAIPGQPSTKFAVYETSEQTFYFMSLAPHTANALFAGTGTANQ